MGPQQQRQQGAGAAAAGDWLFGFDPGWPDVPGLGGPGITAAWFCRVAELG